MIDESNQVSRLLNRLRQEHRAAWLHGILERQQQAVLIIDNDWRICFSNAAAKNLVDCSRSPLEGAKLVIFRPPNIDAASMSDFAYPNFDLPLMEFEYSENEWAGAPAFLLRIQEVGQKTSEFQSESMTSFFTNSWQCWIDNQRKIRFVSPNVLQLTGYCVDEFLVAPNLLINLIHPDDQMDFRFHYESGFDRGQTEAMEFRLISRNGEQRWIHHICQAAFDEDGHWIGRYESYHDITEYRENYLHNQRIQSILETVAFAGQHLLTTAWRTLVPDLLGRLGEAAEVDRVSLLANIQREGSVVIRRQNGWQAADLAPELTSPPFKTGPLETSGLGDWAKNLEKNQPMQTHVRKLPARQRAIFSARNIQSALAIPVFTGPEWWGVIQLDSVREERTWSEREITALQAFANLLGATILRERTEEDIRQLVENERRRAETAWALREVSLALNAVLDFEIVLDRLLVLITQVIPFDIGSILLIENDQLIFRRYLDKTSANQVDRNPEIKSRKIEEFPYFVEMQQNLTPFLVRNTQEAIGWINPEGKNIIQSWIGAPIIIENRVIGFFSLGRRKANSFLPEQATHLAAFAHQAARALQNARLFDNVAETLVNEQRLNEISQIISSSLDLDTVLQTILRLTTQLIGADIGAMALIAKDQKSISVTHTHNIPDSYRKTSSQIDRGLSWMVIKNKASLLVEDYQSHPAALPEWKTLGVHAYMGVPLVAGDECLGVISLFRSITNRPYKDRERFLAEMVARQAGIAIQNARRFEEAQHLATRDSLTGLYNRRYFFELANREFERSRRYNRLVSAILLDLDNLKQINDTYGHPVGDRALQKVADICVSTMRHPDLIGRYGGDELVMLLPETDLANALTVAERLRTEIQSTQSETSGRNVSLTVSIGVASLNGLTTNLEILIDHADQAQYQAKNSGKNKVIGWKIQPDT